LYSNIGYAIVGAMIEEYCDLIWEDEIRNNIFLPLNMRSAGFGPPATEGLIDNPWGHRRLRLLRLQSIPPGIGADNPPAIAPAGAVHCSPIDLVSFGEMHCRHNLKNEGILSAQSLSKLHGFEQYSFGWSVSYPEWAERERVLMHFGSNTMFTTLLCVVPATGFVFASSTNCGGALARRACEKMLGHITNYSLK